MPDFERLMDDLAVHTAPSAESRAYARGVAAGKTRARRQVALVALCVALVVVLAQGLAGP